MERIAQVSDEFISSEITPMDREFIQSMRVAYVTSAIAIATEAEPLKQLLNMYIMVSLQLSVWESTKQPFLLKYKEKIIITLRTLKSNISEIAHKVLTVKDVELLDKAINDWRQLNEDQFYVAFIRFDDFQSTEAKLRLLESIDRKGVFASIQNAEQDLRDLEKLSERALFIANRFPILIRWQSELFVYRIASTDEFINFGRDMEAFRNSIQNVSDTFASIPDEIADQRAKLVSDVAAQFYTQRQETLLQVNSILTAQRKGFFSDIEDNSDSLIEIFRELALVAKSLQQMTTALEKITATNENSRSEQSDYSVSDISEIVKDSNDLTENLHSILKFISENNLIDENSVQEASDIFDALITRIFILTACLIIITILLVTISIVYLRRHSV
jgi:hypothetical protein